MLKNEHHPTNNSVHHELQTRNRVDWNCRTGIWRTDCQRWNLQDNVWSYQITVLCNYWHVKLTALSHFQYRVHWCTLHIQYSKHTKRTILTTLCCRKVEAFYMHTLIFYTVGWRSEMVLNMANVILSFLWGHIPNHCTPTEMTSMTQRMTLWIRTPSAWSTQRQNQQQQRVL